MTQESKFLKCKNVSILQLINAVSLIFKRSSFIQSHLFSELPARPVSCELIELQQSNSSCRAAPVHSALGGPAEFSQVE